MWQIGPINWAVGYMFPAQRDYQEIERPRQGESNVRSLAKAISYRVGGLTVTILVVWVVTGRLELAAMAGIADTAFKVGLYYIHERLWNRTTFGLKPR